MYKAIAQNKRNTVIILVLFVLIIGGLGYLAGFLDNNFSLTIVILVFAIGFAIVQYFFAASQAVISSGAVEIQKADNPRLWRIIENLSITTGMAMPRVYIVNDAAPNAFATGRDPAHAVVAVTTGLLDIMTDAELEGVMAHELGHVKNYDIRVSLIVYGLVVAVGIIADFFLRMAFFGRGNNNNSNPVLLILGLVAAIIAPLVATVVQLAVSRQREYLADATSAMTTRHPDALASALVKLENYGRPMVRQSTSMAHMWIADPLKPGLMNKLFATHPPIPERVARLQKMGGSF
ncbi:protease [Subtercola boreus]|uniref:Protease HtpX homolog n=1 Tax=Subtercola boreus TaxID=120213 RepID=A0A3E0VIJ1_9MICO|nr:M48 family metalloprotease [Subtercola boreus]RFA09772.1 protease [Subtercola boreus]TQL53115.1 heat shock protein [Subtercola boreus]